MERQRIAARWLAKDSFSTRAFLLLGSFLALSLGVVFGYGAWLNRCAKEKPYIQTKAQPTSRREDHVFSPQYFEGLRYEIIDPRFGNSLTIIADNLTVRKAKIGFLRVGLLNEIDLNNTAIFILQKDPGLPPSRSDQAMASFPSSFPTDHTRWR